MGQSQSTSSRYESNEVMPPNVSTASTTLFHTSPKKKYMLVAAIDLGTSYSGFAFSFMTDFTDNPTKCYLHKWESSPTVNYQAPTNILIEKKGEITKAKAFGYDAESTYAKASDESKNSLYLFQRFKMSLDVESVIYETFHLLAVFIVYNMVTFILARYVQLFSYENKRKT